MCDSDFRVFGLTLGLAFLISFAGAPGLLARGFEVVPFGGYRDGTVRFATGILCIEIVGQDCPIAASTEDGATYGLAVDVELGASFWLDARVSWQESDVAFHSELFAQELVLFAPASLDLKQALLGLEYRFELGSRWTPFVGVAGGVTRLEGDVSTPNQANLDLDRATFGLGGGLLVDLGPHFGIRTEIRGLQTSLPKSFDDDLRQLEGTLGMRLRF